MLRVGIVQAMIIVLTGAAGALGDRVIERLRAHPGGIIDVVVQQPGVPVDVSIGTCDAVVDLGSSDYDRRAARRESVTEFAAETLATADHLHASQVVFVSSAMVYGALANNPVPLTEEATLRPDVEFVFARQLASAEELVEQWRQSRPGRASCVLRPAVSLAAGGDSRLAAALVSGFGRRLAEADPPSQYLHLDDLAAAVVLAVTERLDGVYNVAPDGWVAGDRVRALSGERPRLPLPERMSELVAGLRWRFQRGPIPPGSAVVHAGAVGGVERPPPSGRLGAHGHERTDLRREHRGAVVDHGVTEASTGAGARCRRRRSSARRRSSSRWWLGVGSVADERDQFAVGDVGEEVADTVEDDGAIGDVEEGNLTPRQLVGDRLGAHEHDVVDVGQLGRDRRCRRA